MHLLGVEFCFPYYKIHLLYIFKSTYFKWTVQQGSVFMHLCILQHNLLKTPPITLRGSLTPSARNPCTQSPAPANLWSVSSLVLPLLLGISYKWCHTICSLLYLAFVHLTWYYTKLSTLLQCVYHSFLDFCVDICHILSVSFMWEETCWIRW